MAASQTENGQGKYEAELKIVTLLFVDLVDSMQSISDLSIEDASDFLELVTNRVTEIGNRHGGTVASLAGDGALFLFGVPTANSKHALNACQAALEMRDEVRSLSEQGNEVSLRVGLSSGEVLVRPTKTGIGWQYSATGMVVHMGARMEQIAAPGIICATRAVFELASNSFAFTQLKPQHVKGLEDDVIAFSLDSKKAAESSEKDKFQTKFYGRAVEIERLREICREAPVTGSPTVILTGDAGVGKSRLLFEVQNDLRSLNGFQMIYYKGYFGFLEPFSVVRHCVTQLAPSINDLDRDGFLETVLAHVSEEKKKLLVSPLSKLYDVVSAERGNGAREVINGTQKHNKIFGVYKAGFAALLTAKRETQNSVFILDEFLEFDEESREILQGTMSAGASKSEVFIVSMRSDRVHHSFLSQFDELRVIRLKSLSEEHALEIVDELNAQAQSITIDAKELVRKSGGNPLFIEELMKAYRGSRGLSGEPSIDAEIHALPVKSGSAVLTALISERVDRLPRAAKDTLRVASILGEEFSPDLLSDVVERSGISNDQVDVLISESFLLSNSGQNVDRLRFVHPLVHEVVRASILRRDSLNIHSAAFHALKATARMGDHAEALALAHHANEAHLWLDAVKWYSRAGNLANERAMNSQAIALYTNAINASNNLESVEQRVQFEIDLLVEMRNPLYQMGDLDGVTERLHKAKEMAQAAKEARRLGKILLCESHVSWLRGRQPEAYEAALQALEIANTTDDQALRVRANFHSALSEFATGDCAKAAATLEGVSGVIGSGVSSEFFGVNTALSATAESYRARALLELGDRDGAMESAAKATAVAAHSKDLFARIIADISSGIVNLGCGRIEESRPNFESAIDSVNAVEARLMRPVCEANYGLMLIATGQVNDGRKHIENSIRDSAAIGLRFQLATRNIFLCLAQIAEGDLSGARVSAASSSEIAEASGETRAAVCANKLQQFFSIHQKPGRDQLAGLLVEIGADCPQFLGPCRYLATNGFSA